MQPASEASTVHAALGSIELLADAFQSGGVLLAEFQNVGHDVTPVMTMLDGFAEELVRLLHCLPIEAPGRLFQRAQSARVSREARQWQRLSKSVENFARDAQTACNRARAFS